MIESKIAKQDKCMSIFLIQVIDLVGSLRFGILVKRSNSSNQRESSYGIHCCCAKLKLNVARVSGEETNRDN